MERDPDFAPPAEAPEGTSLLPRAGATAAAWLTLAGALIAAGTGLAGLTRRHRRRR